MQQLAAILSRASEWFEDQVYRGIPYRLLIWTVGVNHVWHGRHCAICNHIVWHANARCMHDVERCPWCKRGERIPLFV